MTKHDCADDGGEKCPGCSQCARAGKYDHCGYVCGHDNGYSEEDEE